MKHLFLTSLCTCLLLFSSCSKEESNKYVFFMSHDLELSSNQEQVIKYVQGYIGTNSISVAACAEEEAENKAKSEFLRLVEAVNEEEMKDLMGNNDVYSISLYSGDEILVSKKWIGE